MPSIKHAALVCLAALSAGFAASASAQSQAGNFPSKPVTVIINIGPGGSVETQFRLYFNSIQESTGINRFIFDFKPGAGGTIAYNYVAKAAPDGYTLGAINAGFTIVPAVYPNLPYDNIKDFAPVTMVAKSVYFLMVHPAAPYKTLPAYIAYARAHPKELNFGTSGLGGTTHLPGELLHYLTKTSVTFIHYRAPNQRLLDTISGRIHAAISTFTLGMSHVKAGKLRALGVTSNQRVPVAPDIPTIEEQGVPGYDYTSWTGLTAPARTPPAIINTLNNLFVKATRDPNVIEKLAPDGGVMVGSTPEEFARHIAAETARLRKLIEEAGLKLAGE